MENHGPKIRGRAYGPWLIGAWENSKLDREKTCRSEKFTPTHQAMGGVEVSDLGASLLRMWGTLYASRTSEV